MTAMAATRLSTPAQVGAAVRGARRRAAMTQSELADRAGVSRRWIIMLEQGQASRAELGKILDTLDALGLSLKVTPADQPSPLAHLLDDL